MAIGIVGSNNGYSRTASDNRFLKLTGGTVNGTLAINSGSISTSQPLTLTQTWNASGVTFAAQVVNITTTSSANGSAFFDVKQNDVSRFKVVKSSSATTAQIIINGGDANPCSFTCGGNLLSIANEGNQNVAFNGFTVTRNANGSAGLGGSITSTQTWNVNASIFTGFDMNVTDTNSDPASLLMNLRVGGTSQFKVSKGGSIFSNAAIGTNSGSPGANGLSLEMRFPNCGIGANANGDAVFYQNSVARTRVGYGVAIASNQSLGFTNAIHVGGDATVDTIIRRDDAAATLAQRNGNGINAAQTFRIYGTFTARGVTTNLEALEIKSQSAGSVIIQSLRGSTGGTARDIELRHGAVDTNGVITNGTLVATVKSTGLEATNLTASGVVSAGSMVKFPTYPANSLPPTTGNAGAMIYVTGDAGGPTMAFCDGASWLRVSDNGVVTTES